jgi:hypothetical protein
VNAYRVLQPRSAWSVGVRCAAALAWSAFLGAVAAVLALLAGWERLLIAGSEPGLGLLAAIFGIAWLVALVPAAAAWALSRPSAPGGGNA